MRLSPDSCPSPFGKNVRNCRMFEVLVSSFAGPMVPWAAPEGNVLTKERLARPPSGEGGSGCLVRRD